MELKSKQEELQHAHGVQELDIQIVGKNLISINGDILRVKHNYAKHYGLKSIDTMNKKERANALAYGDESAYAVKWQANYDALLASNEFKEINKFIDASSGTALDTYNLVQEIDSKFNTKFIELFTERYYIPSEGYFHIIEGLSEKYNDDSVVYMIGVDKIAYTLKELKDVLTCIYLDNKAKK